ncbi:protein TIC 62, chloroplastic-like isoform X5 [Panicum virgatum]|uniref:protein TIC 62, chloroplastic-like isoform X5 n=1 Tax=Panicum virgatum TaxID=38727 RepID=UPI0019D57F9B|nr:protein TIC 62, chloroplastic-like isoform X5 [Panicum virgatum]
MEAASRLKLGVGMDTVASFGLSPLRHPSASSACKLRTAASATASRPAAATPRLLKLKQRISSRATASNSNSPAAQPRSSPRATASSAAKTTAAEPPPQREKDLVFVAGATGRVGSRAVRELIKLGFRVRAAVRNAQRASTLVQSVQQLKLDDDDDAAAISPAERLEIVECDLEKQPQEGIVKAIGNASLVVCAIGASEKEILDVTGPYRIDYLATSNLVQAATAAMVEHFILVTSLGTNKIGFPAFLLNLFWGVLCWKRRAEEALIASGIPYTIVRPGGMERPTDAFKETHNLVVAAEDTYVGGLVSNLQVAELIGCMAKNRRAAYCKVVEVVAETTAPLLPMEQLLSAVPSKRVSDRVLPFCCRRRFRRIIKAMALINEQEPPAAPWEEAEEVKRKPAAAKAGEGRPFSPYMTYEGLKPPSSPSPTLSRDSLPINKPQQAEEAEPAASSRTSSRPLSPYTALTGWAAQLCPVREIRGLEASKLPFAFAAFFFFFLGHIWIRHRFFITSIGLEWQQHPCW